MIWLGNCKERLNMYIDLIVNVLINVVGVVGRLLVELFRRWARRNL